MHSESVKSSHSPSAEDEKHKNLDREIREMVSAITHRVTDFHKPGSAHHLDNDDEHGTRIITLAGNNEGATLRSELDDKSDFTEPPLNHHKTEKHGKKEKKDKKKGKESSKSEHHSD
ncbi:hypothetical protein P8452_15698 [Trifolium repens]|nr:hypothetical protein P8452_15698 [Trifolium repens]